MEYRTDLAIESVDTGDGLLPEGVLVTEKYHPDVKETRVEIRTQQASLRLQRPQGIYYTFEGNIAEESSAFLPPLVEAIRALLPAGRILVVGLGNPDFTPDTVGTTAARRTFASAHLESKVFRLLGMEKIRRIAVIAPNVTAKTGIPTAQIVDSVVTSLAPSGVVVVDSFAARSPQRLGTTIQLSDSGISPGSGVGGGRWEISRELLGVPVISIGIPTVIDTGLFCEGEEVTQAMMVTPSLIDKLAIKGGDLIAMALNKVFYPELDEEVIRYLVM